MCYFPLHCTALNWVPCGGKPWRRSLFVLLNQWHLLMMTKWIRQIASSQLWWKSVFHSRQRGSLPEKKWLCVRRVTHYSTIGACYNCTCGSYEGSLTVACRLGDAFEGLSSGDGKMSVWEYVVYLAISGKLHFTDLPLNPTRFMFGPFGFGPQLLLRMILKSVQQVEFPGYFSFLPRITSR